MVHVQQGTATRYSKHQSNTILPVDTELVMLKRKHLLIFVQSTSAWRAVIDDDVRKLTVRCVQAWPWSPDTLAIATWVAADSGEADAISTLTFTARGALGNQHLQPTLGLSVSQQLPSGFGTPFTAGSAIPTVRSEPVGMWAQRDTVVQAIPRFGQNAEASVGTLDGLRMPASVPQMPGSFDGMEHFEGTLPLDGLESIVPSF